MIKNIVTDQFFLSQKSTPATIHDQQVIIDLIDTLNFHQEHCLGMAANMIGVLKNIIIIKEGKDNLIMLNPQILKTYGHIYTAQEGCLSHIGMKSVKRFEKIKVSYEDLNMRKKVKTYSGLTAQIIQHEIDHCRGILI